MLKNLLRSFIAPSRRPPAADDAAPVAYPVDELRTLDRRHALAPLELHKSILFEGSSIAGADLLALYNDCMAKTGTVASPWKALVRIPAAAYLARYFVHTLSLPGARAECGVFQGFSALFCCRVAALARPGFDGADFHLVDSFAGFPAPKPEDFIPINAGGRIHEAPAFSAGAAESSLDRTREVLTSFPGVCFHRGFVPQVLAELPQERWAYVHIDLDLHEATLASLEYFFPRMMEGGVIVCDDYGSKLFPGARKAWDSYCTEHDIVFVTLETGQSVIVK